METKKIVECIRRCEKITCRDDCAGCDYISFGLLDCYHVLKKDSANRLEEMDAELEKRAINDRPYEWISAEDRLPDEDKCILIFTKKGRIGTYAFHGNFDRSITHWMPLPEPPKSKAPTFKDVFLEKFPGAAIENIIKRNCIEFFFPQFNLDIGDCRDMECEDCWNQPYFEEEGEADANRSDRC